MTFSQSSRFILVLLLTCCLCGAASSYAQSGASSEPLKVVVKPLEPFVMGSGDTLEGFSIDLWREIADRLDLNYEFIQVATVSDQLEAVASGTADVAITGISITAEREATVDFSYPYFNAGLQIMTRREEEITLERILGNLFSPAILQIVVISVIVILVGGHLVWLVERRSNPNFPKRYARGVIEGAWWSSVLVVTGNLGNEEPRSGLARLVNLIWLVLGVLLVANFTASVTATATVNHLTNMIAGVSDLNGRQVVTVEGSTAEIYLQRLGIQPRTVTTIQDAYPLLESSQVDAIVYDAPVLRYYETREGNGIVRVVGQPFNPEDYGIALPNGSPLREQINRAILTLKEDGTHQRLYQFWFGSDS